MRKIAEKVTRPTLGFAFAVGLLGLTIGAFAPIPSSDKTFADVLPYMVQWAIGEGLFLYGLRWVMPSLENFFKILMLGFIGFSFLHHVMTFSGDFSQVELVIYVVILLADLLEAYIALWANFGLKGIFSEDQLIEVAKELKVGESQTRYATFTVLRYTAFTEHRINQKFIGRRVKLTTLGVKIKITRVM